MRRLLLALLFLIVSPLSAEETIVADLSQRRVAITTDFNGSEILIFGAVKRLAPLTSLEPLDVIITVSGPPSPVTVRRKDKIAIIWANRDEVEIDSAPSFYAILSSGPIEDILSETEDLRHKITKEKMIRSVDAGGVADAAAFTDALIRIQQQKGAFYADEDAVSFDEQTLFRTTVDLPANLTEGDYRTQIFLVRDGAVVSKFETDIAVQKVGLERFLYNLAYNQPLIYGLMSLAIAIIAGWLASALFSAFRRT
ncbi:TIGR02186 family protein [Shimia ponticola]|uniref:TIGR02186 family protein n=1 Tax=Shimia ponticola TaxID=2582893 RepID=UPI0011BE2A5D|nr:TIGR02186 family protein [Shimia ponticola]